MKRVAKTEANLQVELMEYQFPDLVVAVFTGANSAIAATERDAAFQGLKEYFMLLLLDKQKKRARNLGMPSTLVDEAWHAFMLCTYEYEQFCQKFFGGLIHHRPDPTARPGRLAADTHFKSEVANTWRAYRENLDSHPKFFRSDSWVPLLFTLDATTGAPGGWGWTPEALEALNRQAYPSSDGPDTPSHPSGASAAKSTGSSCGAAGIGVGDGGDGGSSCGSSCGSGCGGD